MYKKILFVICLFVLLPSSAKAIMCGNDRKADFRKQAKNIATNYTYQEIENDVIFNITFDNIPSNFYLYDVDTGAKYYPNEQGSAIVNNVQKNKSYKYWVYVDDALCEDETLFTHYITIPGYNPFYKDRLCEGIEDYKLCNKWININISYDEWKTEVNKYLKSTEKKEIVAEKEEIKGVFDYVIEFYASYYFIILPGVILLCILGIILYNKKHDLF